MSPRFHLAIAALLTAGVAQARPAYYVAVPAAPAVRAQMMTRATSWTWQNGTYVAGRAPERDLVQCQLVARSVGPLQSFSVAGRPFDAGALAACNAKAK